MKKDKVIYSLACHSIIIIVSNLFCNLFIICLVGYLQPWSCPLLHFCIVLFSPWFLLHSLLNLNDHIMYHSLAMYIFLLTIGLENYASPFVNKLLMEYNHAHLFIYNVWLFSCYKQQNEEIVTEIIWPVKPKMFPFWPFIDPYPKLLNGL